VGNKILFWLPQGRLGNLIFQYQAAISIAPEKSTIITFESEFSEIFEYVSFVKLIPIPKVLRSRLTHYGINILRWCVKKNILGSITPEMDIVEDHSVEKIGINKNPGWFSNFWVLDGFFQHEHYVKPLPKLNNNLIDSANELLHSVAQERRVAVHIRFGDYEKWSVYGKQGVCLPQMFYQKAMDILVQKIKNPVFIVFSDNQKKAKAMIGDKYEIVYFDGQSAGHDIAGITLCNHAIISASTFSRWAAFLLKYPKRIVIAPKYWAGFKSGIWFPLHIHTKCFEYINISEYNE